MQEHVQERSELIDGQRVVESHRWNAIREVCKHSSCPKSIEGLLTVEQLGLAFGISLKGLDLRKVYIDAA